MIDFNNYWSYQPVTQLVDLNREFINGGSFLALAKSINYFSFSVPGPFSGLYCYFSLTLK